MHVPHVCVISAEAGFSMYLDTDLAVKEVLSKTTALPTDTTIHTMINIVARIVVPQFADITVIPGGPLITTDTELARFLRTTADHTKHIFRLFAI